MGRRTEEPASATDDAREALLNRLHAQMHVKLRFWGLLRDPPPVDVDSPLKRDLARAMNLPAGRERRDAIQAAGRTHLGDEAFERLCPGLLMRIYDAEHGTHHYRPEVVDTGPPIVTRVAEDDRHSPDSEQEKN